MARVIWASIPVRITVGDDGAVTDAVCFESEIQFKPGPADRAIVEAESFPDQVRELLRSEEDRDGAESPEEADRAEAPTVEVGAWQIEGRPEDVLWLARDRRGRYYLVDHMGGSDRPVELADLEAFVLAWLESQGWEDLIWHGQEQPAPGCRNYHPAGAAR